jgi:hypothetical protein
MSSPHHLSWENFKSTVFLRGQQRVHRVTDSPFIEVVGDGIRNRIGILLEIASDAVVPAEITKFALITTRILNEKGRVLLEVATSSTSLHRQFYHFAVAVAERVVVEKCPGVEAVGLELQCFSDLLEEKVLLGIERQLGLLGELIFLERLVGKGGVGALDSWLGPLGEPHDFRFQASEFELKTTVSPHRIHTIHGTEQLVPSKGCSLYLVSVLLGPAGAGNGFSLANKVAQLSRECSQVPGRLSQFTAAVEACGFRDTDRGYYTRQFLLRRPMGLVLVDESFPAITRPTIESALGFLAPRIESLQYDVSVEGLEHEDGTVEFETVIPS